ncbi:MAG: hypothetical protein ACT4OE_05445 [Sphingosinicella sp.]
MTKSMMPLRGLAALAALSIAKPLAAEPAPSPSTAAEAVDPATIPMPELRFTPDAEAERNYFKYFYFHRDDTDFATAYADIRECDGYARGLSYFEYHDPTPYIIQYGVLPGVIGGAIGSALADAIFASAERRRQRRISLRTCMGFKGYRTYGLPKGLWERFNFDEGNQAPEPGERVRMLRLQARAASGPRPQIGEMSQ